MLSGLDLLRPCRKYICRDLISAYMVNVFELVVLSNVGREQSLVKGLGIILGYVNAFQAGGLGIGHTRDFVTPVIEDDVPLALINAHDIAFFVELLNHHQLMVVVVI